MNNLESLIAALGSEGFHERLYGTIDGLAATDHVSLLRFAGDGRIRLVCTASRPRWRFAHEAQRAYLERFHALDPNRSAFDAARPAAGTLVRRLRREQVPGADYRHYCYDAARLVDRLSVLCADAGGGYALNLYRSRERGPFSEGEAARVGESASLLAACCVKHDRLRPSPDAGAEAGRRVDALVDRLFRLQRGLSRRELAVAARVLAGMTSEGIAADLGIGLQSVLTYRKRAYAKLGVCGQRELFSLALLSH
jgi:DNA-binding CsgD family transcriptional regulator